MANEKELTPREQWNAMQAEKKAANEARIEAEIAAGFLNPYGEGVTYPKFLSVIPKGVSVKDYLTGKLVSAEVTLEKEKELIEWIEADLAHYAPYADFVSALTETKNTKK